MIIALIWSGGLVATTAIICQCILAFIRLEHLQEMERDEIRYGKR